MKRSRIGIFVVFAISGSSPVFGCSSAHRTTLPVTESGVIMACSAAELHAALKLDPGNKYIDQSLGDTSKRSLTISVEGEYGPDSAKTKPGVSGASERTKQKTASGKIALPSLETCSELGYVGRLGTYDLKFVDGSNAVPKKPDENAACVYSDVNDCICKPISLSERKWNRRCGGLKSLRQSRAGKQLVRFSASMTALEGLKEAAAPSALGSSGAAGKNEAGSDFEELKRRLLQAEIQQAEAEAARSEAEAERARAEKELAENRSAGLKSR